MQSKKTLSVLDLFAAPGGLSEGFRQAGYEIVAQVDHDKWGCESLSHNFAPTGTLVIESDIERIRNLRANVDVVIGGPPCQGFSQVGRPKINDLRKNHNRKRFIDDKRNRLYKEFVRIVGSARPPFFVMENVPGIVSIRRGQVKEQIFEDFDKLGYYTDVKILKAADFGVPQIRRRAIFVGNNLGIANPFPKETHFDNHSSANNVSVLGRLPYTTVFDAISDLPPTQAGEGKDEMNYLTQVKPLTDYQRWAREGSVKLYNHVARIHSERDRRLFRVLQQGQMMIDLPKRRRPYRSDIFSDKMKKQSWNWLSRAIVAHMQKDGLMFIHPDEKQARTFTPREAARIQSFQDRFRFMGPMTQQFRQIGNATPPLLARSVAYAIKPLLLTNPDNQPPWISTPIARRAQYLGAKVQLRFDEPSRREAFTASR